MKEHSSPEERLLHIIKGSPSQAQPLKAALPKKEKLLPEIKAGKYGIKNALPRGMADSAYLLKRLNKGLIIICCVLIAGITAAVKGLQRSHFLAAEAENEVPQDSGDRPEGLEIKAFSYYAGLIGKNDLFKITQEVKKEAPKAAAQAGPLELLSNYSLSGVVSEEPPQAIIEDKKSQKTYFLNKGQYLGEFRVDEIREGKVVFDFNGQKFELSL